MFSNLKKNQPDVVRLIQNSFSKNRLVHTYLFYGQKGTMKMEAAKYFANLLLCENGGECNDCIECKNLSNDMNNNVFIIQPDGRVIKKEQILDLEREFAMSSNSKRVFIIEHIDTATSASANSLLKFLEESGDNNYGILITENINSVIPTIRSRAQNVAFAPISRFIIYNQLIDMNIDQELAAVISTLTNNPEEAMEYVENKNLVNIIEFVKKIGMSFESDESNPIVVFKSEAKVLLLGDKTLQDIFLGLLITLQNDKIKFLINPESELVFSKLINTNKINLDEETQIKVIKIMIDLKTKIRYNLSMELALLNMLIEIVRCIND